MIHTPVKPRFQGISAPNSKEIVSAPPHRPVWKQWCCTGTFLEKISSTDQRWSVKLHAGNTKFWYNTWKSSTFMSSGDSKLSLENLFLWLRQHTWLYNLNFLQCYLNIWFFFLFWTSWKTFYWLPSCSFLHIFQKLLHFLYLINGGLQNLVVLLFFSFLMWYNFFEVTPLYFEFSSTLCKQETVKDLSRSWKPHIVKCTTHSASQSKSYGKRCNAFLFKGTFKKLDLYYIIP